MSVVCRCYLCTVVVNLNMTANCYNFPATFGIQMHGLVVKLVSVNFNNQIKIYIISSQCFYNLKWEFSKDGIVSTYKNDLNITGLAKKNINLIY